MSKFILGMDIGYSNLKLAFGEEGTKMKTKILPAGAGPIEMMPQQLTGGAAQSIHVLVDGQPWVAGEEPNRLQGWERELHADYPSTKTYRALFLAALLTSERSEIDVLVTGLPVSQHTDQALKDNLIKQLQGQHQITPKRQITVKDVLVVPQPAGAYMDIIHSEEVSDEDLEVIKEGRTVVIDPGFFSVDWVTLVRGEIRYQSSGTSLKAMSMLLQDVDAQLKVDHGGSPGIETIEWAVRSNDASVLLFGEKVQLSSYVSKAAEKVAANALVPMKKSMREEGMHADIVLLAGGGAEIYSTAAKDLFPKSRIIKSKEPVMANARGFWLCG